MTEDELYRALVALCQDFGRTTEATYDLLHEAIESIDTSGEDEEQNELSEGTVNTWYQVRYRVISGIDDSTVAENTTRVMAVGPDSPSNRSAVAMGVATNAHSNDPAADERLDPRIAVLDITVDPDCVCGLPLEPDGTCSYEALDRLAGIDHATGEERKQ